VGIPPAPRGVPQVEVTFDIDANGIVSVSAKDKATNKEQQIRIQASGGLSDDDIKKMVKEAEENADADKARRELVDVKNQADSLIHSTEKSLTEHGSKVDAAVKTEIEQALLALKEAREKEDLEALKTNIQATAQVSMKLGEAIYKAQQDGAAPGAEATANANEKVVDADFEEVNEPKKGTNG
jgi:molecular chaperone DnaK